MLVVFAGSARAEGGGDRQASEPPARAVLDATAATLADRNMLARLSQGAMRKFTFLDAPRPVPELRIAVAGGQPTSLAAWRGRLLLLNVWASWCAPCREEMPALDRLQKELGGEKFEVVALSLDRKGAEASKKFLDETKATSLKLYVDASAKQGTVLKIVGMPTTILINKEGQELGRLSGPAEWDSPDAKKLIEAALR